MKASPKQLKTIFELKFTRITHNIKQNEDLEGFIARLLLGVHSTL